VIHISSGKIASITRNEKKVSPDQIAW